MEKEYAMDAKKYNAYVEQITPKHSCRLNTLKAFACGGLICVIGQALTNFLVYMGMTMTMASAYTTLCLVAASVILTGFNLVVPIVKVAGAGYLVPITGFANSVAACAIEYKQEGYVFGVGSKIFNIAGPVILYGIVTSGFFGALYFILLEIRAI